MAYKCWQDSEEIVSENLKGLGEGVNRSLKSFQGGCQGGIRGERSALLKAETVMTFKFSRTIICGNTENRKWT